MNNKINIKGELRGRSSRIIKVSSNTSEIIVFDGFLFFTLGLALANFFNPDASILSSVACCQASLVLLLHTVAQISVQLCNLGLSTLKELIAFDHGEVCVKLLHCDDFGELRLESNLFKLSLHQLLLKVVILLLNFF